jgi:hydrogenase nickel incorporation protein HypA/HybF
VHELALADAVITAALDVARKNDMERIDRIDVAVGELQRIKRDVFEFALKQVLPANEPLLTDVHIGLEIEPARFRCRPCGHEFGVQDPAPLDEKQAEAIHFVPELSHSFLRCPSCRSPDFEVLGGRGVSIRRIEGQTP